MEHFVRIVMEKQETTKLLDESIFPDQNLYETEQGGTAWEIALPNNFQKTNQTSMLTD